MTDTTTARVARTLPLEPGGTVEITTASGDLRVRGIDGDRVLVRARDGSLLGDEVVIDAEPGRIRIRDGGTDLRLGPLSLRTHGSRDLDIDVPVTATVNLRTMSGDVEATGIGGPSRWASASGTVRVATTGGPVQLETMSGDAHLEASAPIDLGVRTVSGDIRVRAPRLLSIDVGSTSGDVRIEAELGASGRHAVSSVSGDVELATPSPVRLDAQTIAGDVRGQGPHTAEGGRGRRTLVVGDGSVALSVRTTSGDIRLRVLGGAPAAPVPPIAPVAPAPPSAAAEPPIPPEPPVAPEPPSAPASATDLSGEPAAGVDTPRPPDVPVVDAGPTRAPAQPRPIEDDDTHAWSAAEPLVDRREAARLDILRALERGDLDIETASHRLEVLEESGPRFFRGVVLMAADPLDEVLRLVAEGRLTAAEAAPILAALDERAGPAPRPDPTAGSGGAAAASHQGKAGPADPPDDDAGPRRATSLRLEIRDGPRSVVNLRLPLAVGKLALDNVPGLSGDQVDRIREALASGIRGPILSVDDGDETVRIVVE